MQEKLKENAKYSSTQGTSVSSQQNRYASYASHMQMNPITFQSAAKLRSTNGAGFIEVPKDIHLDI